MVKKLIVYCAVLLFAIPVFCFEIPPKPRDYVHDDAGLLTPSEQQSLSEKLKNFETETSNQIVVAIFPSLEGESLEDISIRLAEAWKIGQKEKDNGVIVLIFPQDRKLRIEVGYGLESVIPDVLASKIIEKIIKPRFRSEQYYEGIDKATDALMAAARGEFNDALDQSQGNAWSELAKFAVVAVFMLLFAWLGKKRTYRWGYQRTYGSSGWSSSGWSSSGGGGFSGGGGGSFGGGGSSGSW